MSGAKRQATLTLTSSSPAQTEQIGRALGAAIAVNLVIALKGDLGAGKTTLTRGIAAGMGLPDRVTSPTFTLINEYGAEQSKRLIHMDTYRLAAETSRTSASAGAPHVHDQIATTGFQELLSDLEDNSGDQQTVLVIEWADQIADLLPSDHLEVRLAHDRSPPSARSAQTIRHMTMSAFGPNGVAVLDLLSAANESHPAS